jgi:hypothetical protein
MVLIMIYLILLLFLALLLRLPTIIFQNELAVVLFYLVLTMLYFADVSCSAPYLPVSAMVLSFLLMSYFMLLLSC